MSDSSWKLDAVNKGELITAFTVGRIDCGPWPNTVVENCLLVPGLFFGLAVCA